MYPGAITDVEGVRVGHAQNIEAGTGVTAVLFDEKAVCGVDVRGSAPGTRETDGLDPVNHCDTVHGIALCGGSAFGLEAAYGMMQYLEERGIGFDTGFGKVPIVPGAVIFDLGYLSGEIRPDKAMGYEACQNAIGACEQGSIGAGTGATVGKLLGADHCEKSGLGTACITLAGGVKVAALMVVNAFGDIYDDEQGRMIAGLRDAKGELQNTVETMMHQREKVQGFGQNTTIGVVVTNGDLTKAQAKKLAQIGHDGYAMAIRPVHTMLDGDTLFAVSTGNLPCDFNILLAAGAKVVARAICNAIYSLKTGD